MRIGVVIPTRGDRPEFLQNCLRMLSQQTLQPLCCLVVDEKVIPPSETYDITPRYRHGYNELSRFKYLDVIAFMEDDDYYAPNYLEIMSKAWAMHGCPELFGPRYTIYYHLKLKKYFRMYHDQRASAMATWIKPGLNFTWPLDNDPFTDQWLWLREYIGIKEKVTFDPGRIACFGIKHGMTMTGGNNHINHLHRYVNDDERMDWLDANTDWESFEFYKQLSQKLNA
jgi:glycosyltransferase involved in cell wall biosynthesis